MGLFNSRKQEPSKPLDRDRYEETCDYIYDPASEGAHLLTLIFLGKLAKESGISTCNLQKLDPKDVKHLCVYYRLDDDYLFDSLYPDWAGDDE